MSPLCLTSREQALYGLNWLFHWSRKSTDSVQVSDTVGVQTPLRIQDLNQGLLAVWTTTRLCSRLLPTYKALHASSLCLFIKMNQNLYLFIFKITADSNFFWGHFSIEILKFALNVSILRFVLGFSSIKHRKEPGCLNHLSSHRFIIILLSECCSFDAVCWSETFLWHDGNPHVWGETRLCSSAEAETHQTRRQPSPSAPAEHQTPLCLQSWRTLERETQH